MLNKLSEENVLSAIFGIAVGDALGVPVEFESREDLSLNPVQGMRSGGTYGQPAGTWSDDSSLTFCTMEALLSGNDYTEIMKQFVSWIDECHWTAHHEVFDMGIATRKALVRYSQGESPLQCGGMGIYDNGNGSLMRIMPAALWAFQMLGPDYNQMPEAYQVIHDISSLTHAHPISLIACGIYCSIAGELLNKRCNPVQTGIVKAKAFYRDHREFAEYLENFERVDLDTLMQLERKDIDSSGYVVSTLEAALWCLCHTESYSSCLLTAVNLGEDTDTVAAVAGGLAGIQYGIQAIPSEWLEYLARAEDIRDLCHQFSMRRG